MLVTIGEQIQVTRPPFRHVTFATPAHWQADIVELPWGRIALEAGSDRSNEGGGTVSPDFRYAAVPIAEGLWVGDVRTGNGRIITSPLPEQWPIIVDRHLLVWVMQPHWSSDSKWIFFQSNRERPYTPAWWRIAATGGVEERVSGEVLVDDAQVAEEAKPGRITLKQIQDDGFFFRSFSPDGRWAAADKTESPTFRLYNLERPEASITYTGVEDQYAGTWNGSWSPDSTKVIFHSLTISFQAPKIGVLSLKDSTTVFYSFPELAVGLASAVGFVGNDQLLVAVRKWNDSMTDAGWPGETDWWLLNLHTVPPMAPGRPSRLLLARVAGPPLWQQTQPATGGWLDVDGEAWLTLQFDVSFGVDWISQNVQTVGQGVQVSTADAILGIATVHIQPGIPGDNVRIRVPTLGFDLEVRRTAPFTDDPQGGGL
jgi:hypothetical protein